QSIRMIAIWEWHNFNEGMSQQIHKWQGVRTTRFKTILRFAFSVHVKLLKADERTGLHGFYIADVDNFVPPIT
ncbi:hypothetical protein JYU34_010832, partial [Plutella xylostella]